MVNGNITLWFNGNIMGYIYIYCLVVNLPLWKIWKSVGMNNPNIWKVKKKHVPNHQPHKYIYSIIIYIYTHCLWSNLANYYLYIFIYIIYIYILYISYTLTNYDLKNTILGYHTRHFFAENILWPSIGPFWCTILRQLRRSAGLTLRKTMS